MAQVFSISIMKSGMGRIFWGCHSLRTCSWIFISSLIHTKKEDWSQKIDSMHLAVHVYKMKDKSRKEIPIFWKKFTLNLILSKFLISCGFSPYASLFVYQLMEFFLSVCLFCQTCFVILTHWTKPDLNNLL